MNLFIFIVRHFNLFNYLQRIITFKIVKSGVIKFKYLKYGKYNNTMNTFLTELKIVYF